jgi:hypothetical protein
MILNNIYKQPERLNEKTPYYMEMRKSELVYNRIKAREEGSSVKTL